MLLIIIVGLPLGWQPIRSTSTESAVDVHVLCSSGRRSRLIDMRCGVLKLSYSMISNDEVDLSMSDVSVR
jgi:hypothetical protein